MNHQLFAQLCVPTTISADPVFNARVDDLDPFICDLADLQALIEDAPESYARAWLSGIGAIRQQLILVTGRG